MVAIGLALGASLAWGFSDFLGGLHSRKASPIAILVVSQLVGLVLAGMALALWGGPRPHAGTLGWAALSGCADVVGLWALYRGLACGAMSVVAPIAAGGAAPPVIFAFATGERPPAVTMVALALVLAGIVASSQQKHGDELRPVLSQGVAYGVVAAFAFGLAFIAIGQAHTEDVAWTVFVNRLGSVALVFGAFLAVGRPSLRDAVGRPGVAGIGALDVAAVALLSAATVEGMLSITSALASLYPLVTVVLAALVLREPMLSEQRAGIAAAITAVMIIGAFGSPGAARTQDRTESAARPAGSFVAAREPVQRLVPLDELRARLSRADLR